jgi:hypothetical protein
VHSRHLSGGLSSRSWGIAKGRSSSRKINYRPRKLFAVVISKSIYLDICWLQTWGNPAVCATRDYSIEQGREKLPILPSAILSFVAHVDTAAELALLDGPYPSAAETVVPPEQRAKLRLQRLPCIHEELSISHFPFQTSVAIPPVTVDSPVLNDECYSCHGGYASNFASRPPAAPRA